MESTQYAHYLALLTQELVPALGCTEPIAIAFASAKARELLGSLPQSIVVYCSANIIKNVKSVTVPNSGNLKGVAASAILGALGGDASLNLNTLSSVTQDDRDLATMYLGQGLCEVRLLEKAENLHIIVEMRSGEQSASVEITKSHTNIHRMERNGVELPLGQSRTQSDEACDFSFLSLEGIMAFVEALDIEDVRSLLDMQVACNMDIAQEGLKHTWGANVGQSLLKHYGSDIRILAKALPAAGSDARMSGCSMPVIINSGSGNQGLTASLPVIAYASSLNSPEDRTYRALVLSNLVAIYQKSLLGKLSAFCGAVSAAAGSGAGIAYLFGSPLSVIEATITNTLANVSGIVCDGAKASCAAKIASAVDAAQMGYYMASDDRSFQSGEGLVQEDADKTIHTIGRLGREGMRATDLEICKIMLEN
ncbi:L-serine ammonia-lyase, iron-sulfur-dependent, subunit alpha [Sphaerochaeta sp. PS]|uniref:L-cysteine desulfidase family protein n=1 Tax=Sphaerochaeta sp. PS TaxID=3076336 RepID=UPI0028A44C7F|nr:L-serine ammonia-lyase, iron-sulfur-dependent, subunit alpha [Sphaerochaeta sp. PS]MDT4762848.1 L-serine ammonia-lyase, iron-sulfur-dependent, subunit alpha [Sphaerochaeta sp. PS]